MNREDVVGYLVLNERLRKNNRAYWNCTCTLCGNDKDIREDTLQRGNTVSCGCYQKSKEHSDKMKQLHQIENLTGNIYGELTVLHLSDKRNRKQILWTCLCSCGRIVDVWSANLKNGNTKTCGDYEAHRKKYMKDVWNSILQDLTGLSFGDWLVLYRDGNSQPTRWICQCRNCGKIKSVLGNSLKKGQSTSCGCRKHNESLTGTTIGIWKVGERSFRTRPNGHNCTTYLCECMNCGTKRYVDEVRLLNGTSLSCGCVNSGGTKSVIEILKRYNVECKTEYKFKDLFGPGNKPLRFDIAILNNKNLICLIEFQGIQHYMDYGDYGRIQREITDPQKKQYCTDNNIKLFEIKYNDNIDEKVDEILAQIAC